MRNLADEEELIRTEEVCADELDDRAEPVLVLLEILSLEKDDIEEPASDDTKDVEAGSSLEESGAQAASNSAAESGKSRFMRNGFLDYIAESSCSIASDVPTEAETSIAAPISEDEETSIASTEEEDSIIALTDAAASASTGISVETVPWQATRTVASAMAPKSDNFFIRKGGGNRELIVGDARFGYNVRILDILKHSHLCIHNRATGRDPSRCSGQVEHFAAAQCKPVWLAMRSPPQRTTNGATGRD